MAVQADGAAAEPLMLLLPEDTAGVLRAQFGIASAAGTRVSFEETLQALARPPAETHVRVNLAAFATDDPTGDPAAATGDATGSTATAGAAAAVAHVGALLEETYAHRRLAPPGVTVHPSLPDLLVVPSRGPRSQVEPAGLEVFLDQGCAMAVLRGSDVFAPGILGMMHGVQQGSAVSLWCDTDRACLHGATALPPGARRVFVGNGRAELSRRDMFGGAERRTSGLAVRLADPLWDAPQLTNGPRLFLQNLPSCLVGHELDPQPGERVLDMCAAPGGKTSHLAWLMAGRGELVACERSARKAESLRATLAAMGLDAVTVIGKDVRKLLPKAGAGGAAGAGSSGGTAGGAGGAGGREPMAAPSNPNKKRAREAQHFAEHSFDRVLLDGPCSGLGQRPRLRANILAKDLEAFGAYQKKLFETAVRLVRSGGRLVYSTCTINPQENEEVVAWALQRFPQLQLLEPRHRLGSAGWAGFGLAEEAAQRVQRFHPTEADHTIGFFLAAFTVQPLPVPGPGDAEAQGGMATDGS